MVVDDFLLAARYGDLDDIRVFLEQGVDLAAANQHSGNTALHLASANGHVCPDSVTACRRGFDLGRRS